MIAENQAETLSCYPTQFSNMVAENKTVRCTLKFKVTTRGIWNVSEDKSPEGTDGQRDRVSVGGSKRPGANVLVKPSMPANSGKRRQEMSQDGQRWKKQKMDLSKDKSWEGTDAHSDRVSVGGSKRTEANASVKPSMPVNSGKRRPEMSLDVQRWKKQKMDRNLKLECSKILKELMNHSLGWVFSHPVDPLKLKIPDYFEIIKNPMDLGTVKHKLEGNMYFDAKEFGDDVKLTFENAKSYNPPSHEVHHWAEILDANFSRRWRLLEAKLKLTNKNDEGPIFAHYTGNNGQDTRPVLENNHQDTKPVGLPLTKAPMHDNLGTSRQISLEERQKSRPRLMQVKPGKAAINGCSSLDKTAEKCMKWQSNASGESANLGQSLDSTEAKCSSWVSGTGRCFKNVAAQTSASDISSERSSEHNYYGDSKLDCEVKCTLASLANSFSLDSDGPGVVLNEEKSPHSTPAKTPASFEGWMVDVQMSPRKALRAAMLKSRFADTIFKATHPALLDHSEKSDLSRMQQERERLEKEQLKEKARIEAQIKAAEAASRRREQDDLKRCRERERKAARMALEKMEKTVEIDKNASILKDLETLFGLPGRTGYPDFKTLARLGLHMKDDYLEEDEDAILNGEEGEIMS
ncbi:hypothetical protein C2S53_016378 [Perilla frutescens var. hirtella]|uniref:Bromo domain-containing protein n=1 Tax=Perilla frutescens var. hirtella TaxID=608512 RepID=A0AAD4J1P3_PERFH|nr:hypothetical protein C2S53_016378 [Perilla frutescens var. hirtella]